MDQVNEAIISYTPKEVYPEPITTPEDAEMFFREIWNKQIGLKESFYVVAVNGGGKVMSYYLASIGGINATIVEPTDILRFLILSGADRFMIAHNHPSSYNKASQADIEITKKLASGAKMFGIELMDHLILFPEMGYLSFRNSNLL